jgi:hypothetical protein
MLLYTCCLGLIYGSLVSPSLVSPRLIHHHISILLFNFLAPQPKPNLKMHHSDLLQQPELWPPSSPSFRLATRIPDFGYVPLILNYFPQIPTAFRAQFKFSQLHSQDLMIWSLWWSELSNPVIALLKPWSSMHRLTIKGKGVDPANPIASPSSVFPPTPFFFWSGRVYWKV